MEKVSVFVEIMDDSGVKFARVHRTWYGPKKDQTGKPRVLETKLEFGEFENVYGAICMDDESLVGRSTKVDVFQLVLTSDPSFYGTDDERRQANKMIFNKINFGEWCLLGEIV